MSNSNLHIWDHPESRISFLETVLGHDGWEATVHDPEGRGFSDIASTLGRIGIEAQQATDGEGRAVLKLQRFDSESGLLQAVKEQGLVKGFQHSLMNFAGNVPSLISQAASITKQVIQTRDIKPFIPLMAMISGGIYTFGDIVQIFAGMGNQHADVDGEVSGGGGHFNFNSPADAMQSLSGVAATVQSLIFLAFAKEGKQQTLDNMMHKVSEALQEGADVNDLSGVMARDDLQPILGPVGELISRRPVHIGAATQMSGQVALAGSGFLRMREYQDKIRAVEALPDGHDKEQKLEMMRNQVQGSREDIATALSSLLGWSLILKPGKPGNGEKLPWTDPGRVLHELDENPNKVGAVFLTIASLSGMKAAISKGNPIQALGYFSYLLGDLALFFVNSGHFGSDSNHSAEELVEVATTFLKKSPLVFSGESGQPSITQLAQHLAQNSETDPAKQTALTEEIEKGVTAKLAEEPTRFQQVVQAANALIAQFPDADVKDKIADWIVKQNGVSASKEAFLAAFDATPSTAKMVQMQDIGPQASALILAMPSAANAESAMELYDALSPHMRTQESDAHRLDETINRTAKQQMGMPGPQVQPQVGH